MADISIVARLVSGIVRNVDIASNTLVVNEVKVGGASGTLLTKTILDNLVTLQDGSDISASLHHHDGRYYTETEIGGSGASSGSDLVGDDNTYSNFTPAAATVKGALSGIDTALATAGGTEFADDEFRVTGSADATKKIALEADGITTATTRTITMPDANVDLGDIAQNASDLSDHESEASGAHAASAISNTPAGNITATTVQAAIDELDSEKLDKTGGTMSGAIAMGSSKITGLGAGTAASDAINKGQLDSAVAGLSWKAPVRAASTADIDLAVAADPNPVDGVTLANGDRILLKNQDDGEENGIYDAVTATDPTTWVRSSDADTAAEVEGAAVLVQEGTANADKGFTQTADSVTLGTTALTWIEFFGGSALSAGDGIDISSGVVSTDLKTSGGLKIDTTELAVEPADFAGTGLEDDGSDNLRLASQGNGIAGGAGSTLSVDPATEVAGSRAAVYVGADGVGIDVDNSTLDHSSSTLQVKSGGIGTTQLAGTSVTAAKLGSDVAGDGLKGGNGSAIDIEPADFAGSGLEDDGSDNLRIASGAYDGDTITGGAGSAAAVQHAPKRQKDETAGETLTAGVRALRWGKTADGGSFTGRVYLADKDASSADDFHVMGVVVAAGETAASTISGVVKAGELTATSHGLTIGEPVYLGASGALTSTAPSSANEAVVKVGMAKDANTIDVQIQIMGVN